MTTKQMTLPPCTTTTNNHLTTMTNDTHTTTTDNNNDEQWWLAGPNYLLPFPCFLRLLHHHALPLHLQAPLTCPSGPVKLLSETQK